VTGFKPGDPDPRGTIARAWYQAAMSMDQSHLSEPAVRKLLTEALAYVRILLDACDEADHYMAAREREGTHLNIDGERAPSSTAPMT
jgi:hypothetical protein